VPTDAYVLVPAASVGGEADLAALRGFAVADAHARFRRQRGEDVLLALALDAQAADLLRPRLDALGLAVDWERSPTTADPAVERWAQWLIGKLEEAGRAERHGDGWRLSGNAAHEESERRLAELPSWSDAALAEQRELLKHVDAPADEGDELEQSLSKLAAAGWSVEAKGAKAKEEPAAHFAAGHLPLATGEDWRAPGAVHPRLAAALTPLVAAVAPDERGDAPPAELARSLPAALTVALQDSGAALLDLRTLAKALRDVGALDLADGEPLGPVLASGRLRLRAVRRRGDDQSLDLASGDALVAACGGDAVRFALLHAAAPEKRFNGAADLLGYAARFVEQLREYAAPRIAGADPVARIDAGDGLRRRLVGWCDTAVARSGENHERLALHRATRNAAQLLQRIQDFDRRVTEHRGELAGADAEAVGVALTVLARLAAPLVPAAAEELWSATAAGEPLTDAGWPALQREPAAA
jgi:hypothetical protein